MNPQSGTEEEKYASRMNNLVSITLRLGVLLSAATIVAGMVLLAAKSGSSDTGTFFQYFPNTIPHGEFDPSVGGIVSGLSNLEPFSVIEVGALVLLATPVARVILSTLLFASEGDRVYVIITGGVLTLLLFSMLVAPFIPGFNG